MAKNHGIQVSEAARKSGMEPIAGLLGSYCRSTALLCSRSVSAGSSVCPSEGLCLFAENTGPAKDYPWPRSEPHQIEEEGWDVESELEETADRLRVCYFRPPSGPDHMVPSEVVRRLRIHLSAPNAHDEIRDRRPLRDFPQSVHRDRLTTSQKDVRGSVAQECKVSLASGRHRRSSRACGRPPRSPSASPAGARPDAQSW